MQSFAGLESVQIFDHQRASCRQQSDFQFIHGTSKLEPVGGIVTFKKAGQGKFRGQGVSKNDGVTTSAFQF
jgi:hypothetical protein